MTDDEDVCSLYNVVNIDDFKISGGKAGKFCQHKKLVYNTSQRTIYCEDCKRQVEAFDALVTMAQYLDRANDSIRYREDMLKESMQKNLVLLAAKKVEKAWRSRSMAPSCPHCYRGILPEDRLGDNKVKKLELQRRKFK